MCDFHSCCIRVDGAVAHLANNSHSSAVAAAGWKENDQFADLHGPRFVEAEWDGNGKYLGAAEVCRGPTPPNAKQAEAIDRIYGSLSRLLADPEVNADVMLFDGGIFAGDEYADIRWRVLISDKCPKRVADKLVYLALYANGEQIKSLDPRITTLAGNLAIKEGYTVCGKNLTSIGGNLDVYGSATFPVLTSIGGNLAVSGSATFPVLTMVNGNPYKQAK
jgi:hypothetical protein